MVVRKNCLDSVFLMWVRFLVGFCHVSVIRIGQWSCGTRGTVWVHEREERDYG